MSWKNSFKVKEFLTRLLEGEDSPEKTQENLRKIKISAAKKIIVIENEIRDMKSRLAQLDKEYETLIEAGHGDKITDNEKIAYNRLEASISALETQKMLIQKDADKDKEKIILGAPLEKAAETQREEIVKTAEELRSLDEIQREVKYETKDVTSEFDRKLAKKLGKQLTEGEVQQEENTAEKGRKRERVYTG